jgi:hypothetical protein
MATAAPNPKLGRVDIGALEVGVNVTPAEYSKWFPKFTTAPAFTRVFFPAGKGLYKPTVAPITGLPQGTLPWCSHKDEVPVKEVGKYWTALLAQVKPAPGRKLQWTFRHEGEDYDRTKFLNYWRDLRLMWEDHPQKDRIELVNIHTLYPSRWKAMTTDWRKWMLPGVTHIDGWDCYPPQAFDVYEPPGSIFGLAVAASREFGMPYCIPEWGVGLRGGDKGDRRAAYFNDGFNYLSATGCRYLGLWCSSETLGGKFVDYRPHDKPTLGVWNAAFAKHTPK